MGSNDAPVRTSRKNSTPGSHPRRAFPSMSLGPKRVFYTGPCRGFGGKNDWEKDNDSLR